jgi:DNA-binding IclR family transcriptional regulator
VRVRHPGERKSIARSATRALDILEYFGEVRRPVRAVEIARNFGMQASTTDQLLKTMVDSAHLVFDGQMKTYSPSPRLAGFTGWMLELFGTDQHLRSLLLDVEERTHTFVTLTTPHDLFMQVLDIAIPAGHHSERGTRVAMFGSSVGSVYLSTLNDRDVARLASRARVSKDLLPAVLDQVGQVRRDGFADGPTGPGLMWAMAMPIPARKQTLPLVLGLAGAAEHVKSSVCSLRTVMSDAIARWVVTE